MEKTINTGSTTATLDPTARQPRPLIMAIVLTSLLYFGVRPSLTNTKVAVSETPQTTTTLSESVAQAVVQDLSQRSGLPKSALKIVEAKKRTWLDRCLVTGESDLFCSEALVYGWEITVASKEKRWVYRTNASGSAIELNDNTDAPSKKSQKVMVAQI